MDNNTNNVDVNVADQPIITRRMILICTTLIGLMLLISIWAWVQLPDEIPVHWGLDGQPDRYGNKFEGLMIMPLMTVGLTAFLLFLPKIEPRRANLARSQRAYRIVTYATILLMLALHTGIILNVLDYPINVDQIMLISMGVVFLVIGNVMGTVRSNFFFGIRTPWTLSSEYSWRKTHRMGSRVSMLIGALFILVGVVVPSTAWMLIVILAGALGMTLFLVIYSYIAWRNDPERNVIT